MDQFLGLDPISSYYQTGILMKRPFISKGFYAVLIAVSSDCVVDSQAYLKWEASCSTFDFLESSWKPKYPFPTY